MRRRHILPFLLISVCGCSANADVIGPDPIDTLEAARQNPLVQTDSSRYHVRTTDRWHEITMRVSFINRTPEQAYFRGCRDPDPPIMEKLEDGEWVIAYHAPVALCFGSATIVEPGQRYEYVYRIVSGLSGSDVGTRFQVEELSGVYRLNWGILRKWDRDPSLWELLPLEQRISQPFELVVGPGESI